MSRQDKIISLLEKLSDSQLELLERIGAALVLPVNCVRNPSSDIVTGRISGELGDILKMHHVLSEEPFTKDKFEYALEQVLNRDGKSAKLAPKGNPGHDITVENEKWSLKTQADANIKFDALYISKFKELGHGPWRDESDLIGLRKQFLDHMQGYDRILILRGFRPGKMPSTNHWFYELVEIPKVLFEKAAHGKLSMQHDSKQDPKPGYCRVLDEDGHQEFCLYFDGGSERKLQIKEILKRLCTVHATWTLPPPSSPA